MTRTQQLACDLIARPSVTPNDGGCQDLLAARLATSGFHPEHIDRNGIRNLWLRRGTEHPLFVFAGHTDVVPAGPLEKWQSPPFEPTVRDGTLHGRGAADMKTSIAAFTVAAEEFVAGHPNHRGSIAFLLTSDEEGPATDGTVAVVEALAARGEHPDFALVGEPSCVARLGDTIKTGRRGSLTGRLRVRGIQGHVAYPHLARNPVHEMAPALAELAATHWDDGCKGSDLGGGAEFPPTTFQVSNVHAGTGAGNVIPGECVLDFNLRFAPISSPQSLRQRIEAILHQHGLVFNLQWTLGAEPFACAPGPLVDSLRLAIHEVTGIHAECTTTGGTSDGRFLARICSQVAEFGPPNESIHKIDEGVRLEDVDALQRIYRRTLEACLSPAGA
jgi:succinyl-diaminopimelate desuccinylase